MRATLDPSLAPETLYQGWQKAAKDWSLHQKKIKVDEVLGHINLATSAREPLSRYRQDASLLGFPSSLDQEDPPSLPGTEIFSPWWMTAGPWETWGMEASISCTKEKIWQIRSETNPRECRVLAFCKGLPWKKCFLCLQVMTAWFFLKVIVVSPFLD